MATSLEQFLEAANTNKVRANNQFELEEGNYVWLEHYFAIKNN